MNWDMSLVTGRVLVKEYRWDVSPRGWLGPGQVAWDKLALGAIFPDHAIP